MLDNLPCASGSEWAAIIRQLGPDLLTIVVLVLTYRNSQKNRKRLKRVERALDGKVDKSEE